MIIAIYIAVSGLSLTIAKWAFFPWIPFRRLPRHRVRYLRLRLRLRLHPGAGHGSVAELWLRWGRLAMLARSGRTRPGLPFIRRILGPVSNCSILIGRAHYRHGLRMPLDEHVVVTSPPRGGKTGWLASVILRYPGPVLSTTTKHDVFALTSGIRARRGPVHVFNPQSVGDVPSTFRWNPVDGCADPATAIRRAGLDLTAVARCVTGLDNTDAERILTVDGSPTASQWAGQLAELRGHADKTAQTIRMTMSRALSFLADPALAAAVQPAPDSSFNIERYLRNPETQYLIAETRGEDSPLGRRAGGSMTTSDHDDALTAALIQIAAHAEHLTSLDDRENGHHQHTTALIGQLAEQVDAIGTRLGGIAKILSRHASVVNALDGLDHQVAAITDQLAKLAARNTASGEDYQPVPPPRWWHLTDTERETAIARLSAWTDHVYRPGYGHLAAALPACWEQHPLCLYTIDWLSELWSALYLSPQRDASTLAAQAEWQTRLAPAAANQMAADTTTCRHTANGLGRPGTARRQQ